MRVQFVRQLQDNYAYILYDELSKRAAVIDPVEPLKVLSVIKNLGLAVQMVLTTHHHEDHAGGNEHFMKLVPGVPVYAGDERVPMLTHKVHHMEKWKVKME